MTKITFKEFKETHNIANGTELHIFFLNTWGEKIPFKTCYEIYNGKYSILANKRFPTSNLGLISARYNLKLVKFTEGGNEKYKIDMGE